MNYSRQKDLIFHAVLDNPCHPTADFIYTYLKNDNPNLSLGTIYRNLNRLSEEKRIRKIEMANQCDRFDGTLSSHEHMLCKNCNQLFDVQIHSIDQLEADVLKTTGFTVYDYNLIVYGVCEACREKEEDEQHQEVI